MKTNLSFSNCCNVPIDQFGQSHPKQLKTERSTNGFSNNEKLTESAFNRNQLEDTLVINNDCIERRSSRKLGQDNSKNSSFSWENSSKVLKCKICQQTNLLKFTGLSKNSKTEKHLKNIKELNYCDKIDDIPQYKLTQYSVYDKADHLCPFDGTLIQDNVSLFFSGYVKPICDENPEIEGGFPCKHMGPITQWWITGYDGGERALVGISSENGDYYLMKPSEKYEPFMKSLNKKIFLTKRVIDFLQETDSDDNKTYENLIYKLMTSNCLSELPNFKESDLLMHAEFVYDQILSYDSTADPDDKLLINALCIKTLAEKAKISFNERLKKTDKQRRLVWRKKEIKFSKATTTCLVENVFESFFQDQMNKSVNSSDMFKHCIVKLTRIENLGYDINNFLMSKDDINSRNINCSAPVKKETVTETFSRNCTVHLERLSDEKLKKFLNKKVTKKRGRRTKFVDDSDSDSDEEYIPKSKINRWSKNNYFPSDDSNDELQNVKKNRISRKFDDRVVSWLGELIKEIDDRTYFKSVMIDDKEINVGDFVTTSRFPCIAHIKYMWENSEGKFLHAHWFIRSTDTVLGEAGNPRELFLSEECEDIPLNEIVETVDVTLLPITFEWKTMGNFCISEWNSRFKNNYEKYFCQKRYISKFARFEDLEGQSTGCVTDCFNCEKLRNQEEKNIPSTDGKIVYNKNIKKYVLKMIRWHEEEYYPGSFVFLTPGTIMKLQSHAKENRKASIEDFDENIYTEKFRKMKDRGVTEDEIEREPFDIGCIEEIYSDSQDIRVVTDVTVKLKKLFRPQNTNLERNSIYKLDLNLLYWSEEVAVVNLKHMQGKCFVAYEKNLNSSLHHWFTEGPYRFYFNEAYNSKTKKFYEPSSVASKLGNTGKDAEIPRKYPTIERPLRSLDVFAGCGGLTEGLHQAGVAECHWAIDKDAAAAHAFRLNYPKAAVFTEDCNQLLKLIINGETEVGGQNLPRKGEVELLCGGPPCQGYSGMNRFKKGQCSQFNNSLIVSYLSYCDYFRPRFFILENVRNFFSYGNSLVLQLTLNCLIKMGYQVTFGVLQCGHFGIPQSRRRAIVLAAAPGEILPEFPEPTNTFAGMSARHLQVNVNDNKFMTNVRWTSAPYRMITVFDAISDLPPIKNGDETDERSYGQKGVTHFQRLMREIYGSQEQKLLKDHFCKQLSALVEERISHIPRKPGADWRDLPNIVVKLSDGTFTKKLKYTHHDEKSGRSSTGAMRGVCCCASKIKCKPEFKQSDTLIPWCLPHTANRHGQWNGLYGRLSWDDYFRTVVTNPEPMGKQGRVLHPKENRLFSVRECARSQGFPDRFQFFGNILDKHRQIGNAVAPPLAKAIGLEIKKSVNIVQSHTKKKP